MTATEIIILSVFVGLIVYDVFAGKFRQPTESQVLRDGAWRFSVIPFIVGFLCGHWFFTRHSPDVSGWGNAAGVMAALFLTDLFCLKFLQNKYTPWRYPGLYVVFGIAIGYFYWPQGF